MSLRPGIFVPSALLAGAPLAAPAAPSEEPSPRDYGTGNTNILQIPAAAFQPTLTGNFTYDSDFYFHPGSGGRVFAVAPVQLPSGSKITQIGLFLPGPDGDASGNRQVLRPRARPLLAGSGSLGV